jgi:hypothetical protein
MMFQDAHTVQSMKSQERQDADKKAAAYIATDDNITSGRVRASSYGMFRPH